MINKHKKIFICATEQSGDNIGFSLIKDILNIDKNIIFEGVGGTKMTPYLNKKFYSLENFNVMGILEVFKKIF